MNEKTSVYGLAFEGLAISRSSGGDALLRVREFILNRLSGAKSTMVINNNLPESSKPPPRDPATHLRQILNDLRRLFMEGDGARINYSALRDSAPYRAYQEECLVYLGQFRPEKLPTIEARRAFWINLYNALVLDAVINFGVKHSVTEGWLGIMAFFRRAAYIVNGQRVSLEDIEHGILRGNRGNPFVPGVHFRANDPRLAWSLPLEPRIHFALNCGGRACPPIQAYAAEALNQQLDLAARSFVDGTVEVKPQKNRLLVSKIFSWYEKDFSGRQGIVKFLREYLPDDHRREYLQAAGDRVQLKYRPYDWALNGM